MQPPVSSKASPNAPPTAAAPPPAPGPRAWPLVGNLPAIYSAGGVLNYLVSQWQAHGDVFRLNLAGHDTVVVTHPDVIKKILSSGRQNFVKGKVYDGTRRVMGNSLLTIEGDAWKQRRALMQPAFHRQSLAKLTGIMAELGARFFDDLLVRAGNRPIALDAHREMVKVTLDVVVGALFGRDLGGASDLSFETLSAALELLSEASNGVLLPAWVPTPHNLKFQRTMRQVDGVISRLIETARKRGTDDGTLLSMLIATVDEETGEPLSDRTIRDDAVTLFIAGHETTALTLTWIFAFLDGRPGVLARMQAEVAEVLGGRDPRFEDVPRLTYIRQVVDETLRLRPTVPLLPRNAVARDTLGGYRIDPGEMVLMFLWATHRHPDYWPDAETFDPDRFGPERSAGRNSWSYVPFSAGPRTCIGNMFSLVETTLLIAQLLNRFDVEVPPCTGLEPVALATLRPSQPVRVVLHPKARTASPAASA